MDSAVFLGTLFALLTSQYGIISVIAVVCLPRWLAKFIGVAGCSVLAGGLTFLDANEVAAALDFTPKPFVAYVLYYFAGLLPLALISGGIMALFDRRKAA